MRRVPGLGCAPRRGGLALGDDDALEVAGGVEELGEHAAHLVAQLGAARLKRRLEDGRGGAWLEVDAHPLVALSRDDLDAVSMAHQHTSERPVHAKRERECTESD
jgi:hypothetical protein